VTDLATIKAGWEHAAREDAMFNIVTDPRFVNGGWNPDEFFRHGRAEIDTMLSRLDERGLRGPGRKKALDFGCGVGRLTQALRPEYKKVWGVDLTDEMVRLAREYNRWGTTCTYVRTGKHIIPSIHANTCDLIYSRITLQHMPQDLQQGYITEFVKLLTPTGVAVFQVPDCPEYHHPNEWLSMYGVHPDTVKEWIKDAGGELLDIEELENAFDYRYTVKRA